MEQIRAKKSEKFTSTHTPPSIATTDASLHFISCKKPLLASQLSALIADRGQIERKCAELLKFFHFNL